MDSMVTQLDNRLSETGGIATMMQHTLYVRDGVADPIKVLGLFHAAATGIAPSLKTQPIRQHGMHGQSNCERTTATKRLHKNWLPWLTTANC